MASEFQEMLILFFQLFLPFAFSLAVVGAIYSLLGAWIKIYDAAFASVLKIFVACLVAYCLLPWGIEELRAYTERILTNFFVVDFSL
ncbi:MAG: hypothetical protein D6805_08335 [Planctomycetota bacterium]|nr:MAG: hypothetical protein D6805_08335 [Planctomycetota bacterium]